MQHIKHWWRSFSAGYVRFVERQGFLIILAACVAVIAGTAVWTNQLQDVPAVPTPPVDDAASAAQLLQESLAQAATPTPSPAAVQPAFQPPLETVCVLRGFDAVRLQPSGVTGVWQLHDAVDLRCETGAQVVSMADGTVLAVSEKGLLGASVTIAHGEAVTALYAGMTMTAGLCAGDPVEAGQLIGFGGSGILDESDLEPHLHLRVTRDGQAIDPLVLFSD